MKHFVVLVNKNNRRVGVEEKIKAHKEGKLHRAFSVFVFNSNWELLLQQRARNKYHSAGLWSNTVCSHPEPNETYMQAVHRRLKEEMGFDCRVKRLFCFTYKVNFDNGLIENEYDCVFVGKFDGEPKLNKREVMNYKWIPFKKVINDVKLNPNKYSIWFKIALKKMNLSQIKKVLR